MRIATSWSTSADGNSAFNDAFADLVAKLGDRPSHVLLYFTEGYRAESLLEEIKRLPAGIKVHGGTSCRAVMTEEGMHCEDGRALALFGIRDPDGAFGVGAAPLGDATRQAAQQALHAALADAGRPGELPALIWMNAAPGNEEQVLAGIADLVGTGVPVLGGSVADDAVAGRWRLLTRDTVFSDGVVISVLFPTLRTSYSFQSGYAPVPPGGTVTSATGRVVHSIDGRPAAEIYRAWTGSLLDDVPASGGNVLALTTLAPLGRLVGRIGEFAYYTLCHPNEILADGSMSLFAELGTDEQLFLMSGSKESLISRAGRVMQAAIDLERLQADQVMGAVVVYCAGCMLTVQDRMDEVAKSLDETLRRKPFIGIFTFGEQGCLLEGQATHGNLMISSLVFAE